MHRSLLDLLTFCMRPWSTYLNSIMHELGNSKLLILDLLNKTGRLVILHICVL